MTTMDVSEKLVKQAISHFLYGVSHDIFSEPVTTYAKLAIEALKKETGATVQEWISVEDRLPDATGRYLAVKKRIAPDALGGNRTDIVILRFFEDSGFKMPIHIQNWINEEINEEITYWMPLPEPPKGK